MADLSSILEAREEARRLFNLGSYSETVRICDRLLAALAGWPGDDAEAAEAVRLLLNDKSRALRNLGQIQSALDCYVQALQSAHESGNQQEETWQLVQFGKIFGKYLERQTLFSACLREAARRYEIFLRASDPPASRLRVQFAIVQDLLGSYYRRLGERGVGRREALARIDCERSYLSAIEHHQGADNVEGVSRATCHLAYARVLFARSDSTLSPEERTAVYRDSLRSFEDALRVVLRSPGARRGRATRRVQQAHIYLLLGNVDHAVHLLSEAILNARQRNDPRAMVLARRMLATALIEQRKPTKALEELVEAQALAESMRFIGFERGILSELAELYLELDQPQKAILALQKNEALFQKELLEFDSGFSGAFEVFQTVAPEKADLYLHEGQRQDYEDLISALIDTGRMLRQVISRYERTQSVRFQSGIHRFAKISLSHSITNELQDFSLILLPLRKSMERKEPLEPYVSDLLKSYALVLERIKPLLANPPHEDLPEKASLREELTQAVQTHFAGLDKVNLSLPHDILFPYLMPGLLREAFLHLVENASAAVLKDPPPEGVPHFSVLLDSGPDGSRIVLLNPGANPKEIPWGGPSTALHGFSNAYWFFRDVLGFDCRFELREDGPRTPPYQSNCVVIEIPPSRLSPTPYQIEPSC